MQIHKIQAVSAASDQEHTCFALSLMQTLEHDTQPTGRQFIDQRLQNIWEVFFLTGFKIMWNVLLIKYMTDTL